MPCPYRLGTVNFSPPLQPARLLRRYKRFLADVEDAAGRVLTVHLPNSGSMFSCLGEGWPALLSHSSNPSRKLPHTLEMVHDGPGWIIVNTLRANAMAREALEAGLIPGLGEGWSWRAEVRRGASRLDFLGTRLPGSGGEQELWVEVKSVTLRLEDGRAGFPDSVSLRGRKHLEELRDIVEQGGQALLLLMVQRAGLPGFRPAGEIDPAWAQALRRAVSAGVRVVAVQVWGDALGMRPVGLLPVEL